MIRLFPASQTRARTVVYWIATALLAFGLTAGGVGDVLRLTPIVEGMTHLGYPSYFCVIIGVWKLLGAAAILAPGVPRLKEWAYAGAFFNFSGAVMSHLALDDTFGQTAPALVFTLLTLASWITRPPTRRWSEDAEPNAAPDPARMTAFRDV